MRDRRMAVLALATGIAAVLGGGGTYAAFTSTTSNGANAATAGTVLLSDNDAGSALLSLTGAGPGVSTTGCVAVTYSGTLASSVRLHGTSSGSIAPYLTLTVTRGVDASASFPSCAGFTSDTTDHIGAGPGVVWTGALSSFPSTWAAGAVDPGPWTQGTTRSYRLAVTMGSNTAAQGTSGTASFTWEARNQ